MFSLKKAVKDFWFTLPVINPKFSWQPVPPGPGQYSSFCEKLKVPAVTNSRPVMTMGCLQVIPALLLASCVTAGPLTSEGPELLDLWADQNIDDINFGGWCSDRNWITILWPDLFSELSGDDLVSQHFLFPLKKSDHDKDVIVPGANTKYKTYIKLRLA